MHSQELGDYLGVESCTDFIADVAPIASRGRSGVSRCRRIRRGDAAEYPPPIPLLARAENLPSRSVMKKYITSDGRLVITEERAPRHQYFQVYRSDGRLVLTLIPGEERCKELGGGNVAASTEKIDGGDNRIGVPHSAEGYIGVKPCGGFGVAMAGIGFWPPVHT